MRPIWAHASRVFSPQECQQIIDSERGRLTETGVERKNPLSPMLFVRNSRVSWILPGSEIDPLIAKAMSVITRIGLDVFSIPLNGFEPPQFTHYGRFGHYSKHRDTLTTGPNRLLSATIQLNCPDDFTGGKLWINTGKHCKPDLKQGDMAVFPSLLEHKVEPVWKGERYSLVLWAHYMPEESEVKNEQAAV
jgi:PKHD-type hydroxylase